MGSRSKARARAQANVAPAGPGHGRPPTITVAAVIEAVQAVAVLLAAVLAGVAAGEGKSYQTSSGVAITIIGIATAIGLGYVALGLARTRRWSRTPALLTQLFTGIVGIYLVQGQRFAWGVPALVLSVAGLVLLLVPPSIKALTDRADKSSALAK
ncbi:MAG TPA: hypothetical protein VFQ44_08065 [Streptosporangiaceae bacterium]|nr:hypothetical protein [Streptosporangiaceae bacterium]